MRRILPFFLLLVFFISIHCAKEREKECITNNVPVTADVDFIRHEVLFPPSPPISLLLFDPNPLSHLFSSLLFSSPRVVSIGFGCLKTHNFIEGRQVNGPGWSVDIPQPLGQPQALPNGQINCGEPAQEPTQKMVETRQGLFLFWIVIATAHVFGLLADYASDKYVHGHFDTYTYIYT
jgi:hypothetical protein